MMKKTIEILRETRTQVLEFFNINMESAGIFFLTDGYFVNVRDMKSQLVLLILMMDASDKANILHYCSNRCRRVTRSVMTSEIQALAFGFDYYFFIRDMVDYITERELPIEACIDSCSVLKSIEKDGRTTEGSLQIDICASKESYSRGKLALIEWIPEI